MVVPVPDRGPVSVSSAEFVRRFGSWQDRAATDPVVVTHHGRPRLVLLSAGRYQQLMETGGSDAAELDMATLMDRIDCGFVGFDRDLRIGLMNPLASTFFRQRRSAVAGQVPGDDMPDLGPAGTVRGRLARTLTSGEVATFEAGSIAYPGQTLRCQVFPFADGVGLLFRNVTQERALRQLEERHVALTAALNAQGATATGLLSPRGAFVRTDAALSAITGRSDVALDQLPLVALFGPDRRDEAATQLEAVLTGGKPRAFDSAITTEDATDRPVRIGLAAMIGAAGIEGAMLAMTAA